MSNLQWYAENDPDYLGQILRACVVQHSCRDCPIYGFTDTCREWLEAEHEAVEFPTYADDLNYSIREKIEGIVYNTYGLTSEAGVIIGWLDMAVQAQRESDRELIEKIAAERDMLQESLDSILKLLR